MDTNSAGFSLLSKSMQKRILEQQDEPVPAEEAKPEAQQPEVSAEELQAIRDAIHAENVRKFGAIDAERMRMYGLSERDL